MTKKKLFSYQEEIVDEASTRPANSLFIDMGLGKTIMAIHLFKRSPTKKVLVVCLKSKIDDWIEDINHELDLDIVHIKRNNLEEFTKRGGAINFEMVWRIPQILDIVNDDWFIIVDESHKIKNPMSKIGKFSQALSDLTPYKVILTGTPQSQGYLDYYNQLYFIDFMDMKFSDFKKRYCVYQKFKFSPVPILTGYKNTIEIDEVLEKAIYFKRDIKYDEIPRDIYIDLKKLPAHDIMKKDKVYKDTYVDNTIVVMLRLRQIASGFLTGRHVLDPSKEVKYKMTNYKGIWLRDFVEDLNKRVVVFYNFIEEKNDIVEIMEKLKIPHSVYDGNKSSLKNFIENENGVAILNFASGSTGINDLVISNIYVAYSPTTNYIDFIQSKKRIDRIGQTEAPVYYYLRTKGSVEVPIYKSLEQGLDFDNGMFDKFMVES